MKIIKKLTEEEKQLLSSFIQFDSTDCLLIDVYELCCYLRNEELDEDTIISTLHQSHSLSQKCLYHQNDTCFCAKERNINVIHNLMKDFYHNRNFGIQLIDFQLSKLNMKSKEYFFCCSCWNRNVKKYELSFSQVNVSKECI